MAPTGIDLEKIRDDFKSSVSEDGIIDMGQYLKGHAEITRLFELLGTVFNFVSSDMKTKCGILADHRRDRPDDFATVQSMVAYELREGLTARKTDAGRDSGSRTFLRLHRALEFFCVLLQRLAEAESDAPSSTLASTTYGETLGKFHPWVVRQMAYLAIRTLPTKEHLIEKYCKQDAAEAEELVPSAVEAMRRCYDIAQDLFSENSLLDLP
ncbi:ceramide-1-phosphate transfer protein-like [Diadema antillarum]|uniref:ceramide-1-phosphate transfer protein-like n=1 Tax=Diadema antillarum TaxID=105358 RepID=UPI003A84CBDD